MAPKWRLHAAQLAVVRGPRLPIAARPWHTVPGLHTYPSPAGSATSPAESATAGPRPLLPPPPACSLEGLSKLELESLADWERTFESKYEVVGQVSRAAVPLSSLPSVFPVCACLRPR